MRRICATVILLVLSPSKHLLGQGQSAQKIIFHVTAVRQEEARDWCTTGECSATRRTVEGYSDVNSGSRLTKYVLECVETFVHGPPAHYSAVCTRLHVNNDYHANLWDDSIAFSETNPATPGGPIVPNYNILSEKEETKQSKDDAPCTPKKPQAGVTRPK
jgi:hypothetical protein